jgi:hypothetical protein
VRLELTNTGSAIRRLSRLATRARSWSGRRDSNSRSEFGRLACFQLHHFRSSNCGTPGRIRTRSLDVRSVALFQLSYRSVRELEHRSGFEPVSQRWQRRVLNHLDQRCSLVGEDRVELSPRVPRTRMLALHHTPAESLRSARRNSRPET